MNNYYEVLEIEQNATELEIKRAYFGATRKYPPEKFPDEFNRIREAYDSLGNPSIRQDLDAYLCMPEDARVAYDKVTANLDADDTRALVSLRQLATKYPDALFIKKKLGILYTLNENYGLAIKTYENILKYEPNNVESHKMLALAYQDRGFDKKALTTYQKALQLNDNDENLWTDFINLLHRTHNPDILRQAELGVSTGDSYGWESCKLLCMTAICCIITHNHDKFEKYFNRLVANIKSSNNFEEPLLIVLTMHLTSNPDYMKYLPDISPLFQGNEVLESLLGNSSKLLSVNPKAFFKDDHIADVLKDLIQSVIDDCDCPDCNIHKFIAELDIFENIDIYRAEIRYIQDKYPEIYELDKGFFQKIFNDKNKQKLIEEFIKKEKMLRTRYPIQYEAAFDKQPDFDPYIREEPKIGRNDPCPCGSGKKYKKCCGTIV